MRGIRTHLGVNISTPEFYRLKIASHNFLDLTKESHVKNPQAFRFIQN